jgi:hypothetical protein
MRRLGPAVVAVATIALAACSGDSSSAPEVTAPPPASVVTTEPIAPSSTSVERDSTTSGPTTSEPGTATSPPTSSIGESTDRYLPDGLGTVIDSAPGVDSPGQVIELIDNVWFFVASETVDGDPNVIPPLPEDRDLLVAYAEAQAAYHEQASMDPLPVEPTVRLAAAMADGGQRLSENVFAPAAAAGRHLDLGDGIVLRPVVIADPRSDTEAFIFDCQLDGTVFVNSDGTLADGQIPGVKEFPQIASVIKRDGEWIVDRLTRDERACA